jgi:hypothetical protein
VTASRKFALALALGAVMLAFAAAGCGGDDDEGSGTGTTAAATTRAENERLTPSQWDEYTKVRDEAQTVNAKAIATLKQCRKVLYASDDRTPPSECFGDSMSNLATTGKSTLDFLQAQSSEVGGACATANAELTGYVKLYVASAQTLSDSIEREDVTGAQGTIENATVALQNARKASVAFTAACKPTGAA